MAWLSMRRVFNLLKYISQDQDEADRQGVCGNMIIEINKDIDRYQESVALGLTVKQLIYAALSLIAGAGIVLLLQKQIGLTLAAYVAVPVVTPLALQGFYQYNGMSFMEVMKRKLYFAFLNRPLVYVSEEGEAAMRAYRAEGVAQEIRQKQAKKRKKTN